MSATSVHIGNDADLDRLATFLSGLPRPVGRESAHQQATTRVTEAAKVFVTTLAALRARVLVATGPGSTISEGRKACEVETLLHQASQETLEAAVQALLDLEAKAVD
jgi:hypothetical protein